MKRSLSALAVLASLALGLAIPAGSASAAGAAGVRTAVPVETTAAAQVQKVDHHWRRDGRWQRERHRGWDRGWNRGWERRGPPRHFQPRSGFYFEFGTPRRYMPPPPRRTYAPSRAHVNWCYNRYRSYDALSNSFQPYNGPRRRCVSPYG